MFIKINVRYSFLHLEISIYAKLFYIFGFYLYIYLLTRRNATEALCIGQAIKQLPRPASRDVIAVQ